MAGRSGGRVPARLARNWFQPGGRDSWFHGESFVPAEGGHPIIQILFSFSNEFFLKVGRITGLDAAYPLYMNTDNEGHLARTDAAFVDVIHTDGGILGFPNPLGHVDFYPNGGKPKQPGCDETENAFQRSLSRFVNRYSKKSKFLRTLLFRNDLSFFSLSPLRSLLWPSSRVDVLRRVGDESFRFPGQSMRKMAAGHPGGLQVDAPSVDGLRRGSRNEREVLLEDQRAATFREERDRLRVTFSFG